MSMTILALLISLLIALCLYLILIYNGLIAIRNTTKRNWSNIDVLLKQRYSEIPKLIETCKRYMQYEQETLAKIVAARNTALDATKVEDLSRLAQAETELHHGLFKLFALAENYPELKANQSFIQLQSRISDLENAISDRREMYNDSVNINNIRIQQFPDLIVAKLFAFHSFDLMQFDNDEIQQVGVRDLFKQ